MRMKLLAAYDDPGGGLAVTSVVRKIAETGQADVTAYSGKPSMKFLDGLGLAVNELKSDLTREGATAIIEKEKPDILLTATGGGTGEQELRNVANERHISSYVILDFWKHYVRRWKYADYDLAGMNDLVLVMDENARREMMRDGFPESRIVVTGHPYLERVFNDMIVTGDKTASEDSYLFLSQPSETIELRDYVVHPVVSVFAALKDYSKSVNKKITLYVKLHPLEKMSRELSDICNAADVSDAKLIFKGADDDFVGLAKECKTVIGYNSIALFEAAALGRRVLSLDVVPMNESLRTAMREAGIELIKPENFLNALMSYYSNQSVNVQNFHKGAIDNCIIQILSTSRIHLSQIS